MPTGLYCRRPGCESEKAYAPIDKTSRTAQTTQLKQPLKNWGCVSILQNEKHAPKTTKATRITIQSEHTDE